jgi:hypothetical protein
MAELGVGRPIRMPTSDSESESDSETDSDSESGGERVGLGTLESRGVRRSCLPVRKRARTPHWLGPEAMPDELKTRAAPLRA